MKIKTNLNRLNLIHDQIKYPSIEKQVMDYIINSGLFKTVTYKTGREERMFVLNETNSIRMSYDQYRLLLNFYGDVYELSNENRSLQGIVHEIEWKEQGEAESKEVDKYLKLVAAIMEATKTADAIASQFEISDEMNKKIENAIDAHFNNKLIKASFTGFKTNLIPKLDNPYTKGIWSWLSFHLQGIKQDGYPNLDKHVGVELYIDGKVKNSRIDEFVKAIQCNQYDGKCKPTIKQMQERLADVADFEEKIKEFDGTKIPFLQDYLAVKQKGVEFRKQLKLV